MEPYVGPEIAIRCTLFTKKHTKGRLNAYNLSLRKRYAATKK